MTLTDTELNALLNQWDVPQSDELADRIFTKAMSEKTSRLMVMFWRHSAWLSLVLMIGGFALGQYENAADANNAAQYFDTLFNYGEF